MQFGVCTYVEYSVFNEVNKSFCLREWVGNPYSFAGRDCAKESTKWALSQLPGTDPTPWLPLEHIFEEGDDGEGLLEKLMVADKYPRPVFKPSRDKIVTNHDGMTYQENGMIQLQTADFAAYELRKAKNLLESRAWPEKFRKSMLALSKVHSLWAIYRHPELIQFCKDYRVPGRTNGQNLKRL